MFPPLRAGLVSAEFNYPQIRRACRIGLSNSAPEAEAKRHQALAGAA